MEKAANSCSVAPGNDKGSPEAELQEFLVSIGWGATCRRVFHAEMQPALTPPGAEACIPPPPNTVPSPTTSRQSVWPSLRLTVAVVLAFGIIFRHSVEDAARGWLGMSPRMSPEVTRANEVMTHARFMSLRPGTSAAEVRERVGLPTSRGSGLSSLGVDQVWDYTVLPSGPKMRVHFYVVAITDGKVVRVLDTTDLRSPGDWRSMERYVPRYFGPIKVQCGSRRMPLEPSSLTATLLMDSSLSLPEDALPGSYVLMADRITLAATDHPIETPPTAVYWRGVLYPLPAPDPAVPASELTADLLWLFRSLGCDETGRSLGGSSKDPIAKPLP